MKWHPIKDWYEEKLDPEGVYLFTFRDDLYDIEHLGGVFTFSSGMDFLHGK